MDTNLKTTPLLNYKDPSIQKLITDRNWMAMAEDARIGAIYDFVRDEIDFGYNASDDLPASAVLADGYGQCNTKTTLLMALLRGAGIACRFHGATIHKELQKGVVEGIFYRIAPESIIHSWAEIQFDGRWVGLEGVILDAPYLDGLRKSVAREGGPFIGYGAGTENIDDPPVTWCGTDTAIQATGVNRDFGVFDDPDDFYRQHGANFSGLKALLFKSVIRHRMNRRVASIRSCALPSPRLEAAERTPVGQGIGI
jgi:transglutaminase-like putative cysteine protease